MSEKLKNFIKFFVFISFVFVSSFYGSYYFDKTYINNSKIGNNVYIEEINLSNLTKNEAIEKINNEIQEKSIKLIYGSNEYLITPKDISLDYNIENLVDKAYNYNKTDDFFENVKIFLNLRENKKIFDIKPIYDEAKLSQKIEEITNSINVSEVDATIFIDEYGNINKTPSKDGRELDIVHLKENIYDGIRSKEYKEVNLKVEDIKPKVSTKDVDNVNYLLAEFSTNFSTHNENRATNIEVASKKTSDILLMPGEEFSYNDTTGKRIAANGYKDAPVIINGKLEQDVGGGVCQVSSTMFNSVMYSGLEVTSRRNHSLKISYLPIGQDAMVSDGGSDFRFKNPYSSPIYIKNVVSDGVLTSRIYGNINDKKNITIKVEPYKENNLDAAKTYIEIRDKNGNVAETRYVGKSVYKEPKK